MMPVGEDRRSYLVVEEGLGWSTMLGAGAVGSRSKARGFPESR